MAKAIYLRQSTVKRMIHGNGLKSSQALIEALDAFIEQQIARACENTKKKNRKIIRRECVFSLFP